MVRIIMLDHGLSRRIRILEDPVCGIEHSSSTFHGGCFLFLFFSVSFFSVSFFFFFFFFNSYLSHAQNNLELNKPHDSRP